MKCACGHDDETCDRPSLAEMLGADVMVEKVDGLYRCPTCLTYSTPFALAFAHHRRTAHSGRPTKEGDHG